MEVVTAGGDVLRVSADENEDLFWALRGGSGNFGIVTSFEYRLFPVGPEILGGAIAWRGDDATQILDAYREFSAGAPRELTSVAVLRIAPPAPWLPKEVHGKPIVAIFVCYSGKVEDGEALVAPLRGLGQPVADILTRRPYVQMQSLLDATQPKGRRYYWKSHYLPGIDRQVIDLAVEHATRIRSPHSAILMFQIQGALGELPAGHVRAEHCGLLGKAERRRHQCQLGAGLLRSDALLLDRRGIHQLPHGGRGPGPHRGRVQPIQPGPARCAQAQVRPRKPLPPHQERLRLNGPERRLVVLRGERRRRRAKERRPRNVRCAPTTRGAAHSTVREAQMTRTAGSGGPPQAAL